jgi:YVTN family beta-propeller protein
MASPSPRTARRCTPPTTARRRLRHQHRDEVVTSTIPDPNTPNFALLSPDGSRLYVLEDKASTVSVINTVTDTVLANISMPTLGGNDYMNVTDTACISPDGSTLYGPGSTGEPLQVVSTATDTITSTISGNPNSMSCAVSPDGSQVWVGYINPLDASNIPVVVAYSTSTHAVIVNGMAGANGQAECRDRPMVTVCQR